MKERRKGLFAEHINKLLKEKMEVSSWPNKCRDGETKNAFVKEEKQTENVPLKPTKIEMQ